MLHTLTQILHTLRLLYFYSRKSQLSAKIVSLERHRPLNMVPLTLLGSLGLKNIPFSDPFNINTRWSEIPHETMSQNMLKCHLFNWRLLIELSKTLTNLLTYIEWNGKSNHLFKKWCLLSPGSEWIISSAINISDARPWSDISKTTVDNTEFFFSPKRAESMTIMVFSS